MKQADNFYVDFHCHPALKPFGKSFNYKAGEHSDNCKSWNSIWHYNPPNLIKKGLNYLFGLTKFSQANFTSISKGKVGLVSGGGAGHEPLHGG